VVLDTINALTNLKPLKPMEVSSYLEASSMDHASDLIINNIFSDDGSDGSKLNDRVERYCVWRGVSGENIVSYMRVSEGAYYYCRVFHRHTALIKRRILF
jgi:uncharacterized protein YkwD